MYVCMYVCMHACMHVCMYVCISVYIYMIYINIYLCLDGPFGYEDEKITTPTRPRFDPRSRDPLGVSRSAKCPARHT